LFYLTHQLANYQLALTGQLSLDAFPNKILTDGQLTDKRSLLSNVHTTLFTLG